MHWRYGSIATITSLVSPLDDRDAIRKRFRRLISSEKAKHTNMLTDATRAINSTEMSRDGAIIFHIWRRVFRDVMRDYI